MAADAQLVIQPNFPSGFSATVTNEGPETDIHTPLDFLRLTARLEFRLVHMVEIRSGGDVVHVRSKTLEMPDPEDDDYMYTSTGIILSAPYVEVVSDENREAEAAARSWIIETIHRYLWHGSAEIILHSQCSETMIDGAHLQRLPTGAFNCDLFMDGREQYPYRNGLIERLVLLLGDNMDDLGGESRILVERFDPETETSMALNEFGGGVGGEGSSITIAGLQQALVRATKEFDRRYNEDPHSIYDLHLQIHMV